jgi:membrane protease YdiL (CAAX protease family)
VGRGSSFAALRDLSFGFAILLIGGGVSGVLMVANLRLMPGIPLFLPATLLWLWILWLYARGSGWPRTTSDRRRELLRASGLSSRLWFWALVAGGLGVVAVMGIAFVTYRFAALPEAAYRGPFEVSAFPWWTQVAIFVAVALTAGVVEEAAFRGYMLSALEPKLGWWAGIGIVTVLFYLAHRSHAYATLAFLPFFLGHGLVLGLLVYFTRSIVPGIVLHAVSDLIVLPMQYGAIPSVGQWSFVSYGGMSVVAAAASIPAWRRLAIAMRRGSEPGVRETL